LQVLHLRKKIQQFKLTRNVRKNLETLKSKYTKAMPPFLIFL
jgi:hypothetical protein